MPTSAQGEKGMCSKGVYAAIVVALVDSACILRGMVATTDNREIRE